MNRIIKFRAWDDKNKLMIENVSLLNSLAHVCQNWTFDFEEMRGDYKILDINTDNIMQFTGLKDLNKVDVYEADIVKVMQGGFSGLIGIIEFKDTRFILNNIIGRGDIDLFNVYCFYENSIQIIGNVFQHPEFLEGKINDH